MRVRASVVFVSCFAAAVSAQTPRSVWDAVFSDSQANRGESVYRTSCASCHGSDLGGGEMAPALRGGEFTSNWNTVPLSELLERIYGTMPLNAPKSLSREQAVDVVAFVLKSGGFPAGAAELRPEPAALQEIVFLAMKP